MIGFWPMIMWAILMEVSMGRGRNSDSYDTLSDGDAADALGNGHHKSRGVPQSWGQRNRTQEGQDTDGCMDGDCQND